MVDPAPDSGGSRLPALITSHNGRPFDDLPNIILAMHKNIGDRPQYLLVRVSSMVEGQVLVALRIGTQIKRVPM